MRRSKPVSLIFVTLGSLMILSAIALAAWNIYTDNKGNEAAQAILSELKEKIPQASDNSDGYSSEISQDDFEQAQAETYLEIDGKKYMGIISIPDIDLELPVMYEWTDENSQNAPCRYSGSVKNSDLIIAAHNYTSFFKRLDELNSLDKIFFTECNGKIHTYEVVNTDLIGGENVDGMKAGSDEWDLTLFTCTWSGWSRITVRAVEVD